MNRGVIKINKVDGAANIADPLTKPLTQAAHEIHSSSMSIRRMSDWF
jgi:hypothetical protein